jgi:thiamine-phosphate pyrophosphorylase
VTSRRSPLICVVTDRTRYLPGLLVPSLAAAAAAGVDLIQVRERDLPDRALLALTRQIVSAAAGTGARVLVNDRLDVSLAAGADGVHLRGASAPSRDVRRVAPPGFLIGRSVHTPAEAAAEAARGACDYLLFGTVLPSGSKPQGHPTAGFAGLAAAVREVSLAQTHGAIPVLAIGGLTAADAPALARAGAAGLAAIGLFAESPDVRPVVAALRAGFDR